MGINQILKTYASNTAKTTETCTWHIICMHCLEGHCGLKAFMCLLPLVKKTHEIKQENSSS